MTGLKTREVNSDLRVTAGTNGTPGPRASQTELHAAGKALREKCPRNAHAAWQAPADRLEVLQLLEESNKGRIESLIPIRHGRMLASPFAFYRGAALNMAADLASTPTTGLRVQACGDCHVCNFGGFGTPERRVIVDLNDLDETLPAPWEWDVKRLAASFVLASRENGHSEDEAREAVLACVQSYRQRMAEYSEMRVLEVWYASIDLEEYASNIRDEDAQQRLKKRLAKARERSVVKDDFPDLVATEGPAPVIKEELPLIFHPKEWEREERFAMVRTAIASYRETLPEARRLLLDRYEIKDTAFKVVGVGSVGTYCSVLLLMAGENDPLFLQVKQARPSVLEAYAGKSVHAHNGQRIVHGYQLMQSASDLFLGWTTGQEGRQLYLRQLRDMKIKPMVQLFTPRVMQQYGELCGWILARAHARSGEPAQIAGYLGKGDRFDRAIADFAAAYADQTERDYEVLVKAVREGRLEATIEQP